MTYHEKLERPYATIQIMDSGPDVRALVVRGPRFQVVASRACEEPPKKIIVLVFMQYTAPFLKLLNLRGLTCWKSGRASLRTASCQSMRGKAASCCGVRGLRAYTFSFCLGGNFCLEVFPKP